MSRFTYFQGAIREYLAALIRPKAMSLNWISHFEEDRFYLEELLEISPDAIITLNAKQCIERFNQGAETIFGYTADEVLGKPLSILLPNRYVDQHRLYVQAFAATEDAMRLMQHRPEISGKRKDNSEFLAEASIAKATINGQLYFMVVLRDISERKRIEMMRENFISNVSHQLRTPITSIRLNKELIKLNPQQQKYYMERLTHEVDRLQRIVDDLLQLSRLDNDHIAIEFAQVDLNETAAQYAQDRRPLAEQSQLDLKVDTQPDIPAVDADEGLIGQVISIILSNAFNYTPPGGQITISTMTKQHDNREWAGLRIEDTGMGILPEEREQLFERFYRGRAGQDSPETGSGLGLAIANEIITRHNGYIDITSDGVPGLGSAFTIWLPASAASTDD